MSTKPTAAPGVLSGIIALGGAFFWASAAQAAQAGPSDLTDFIARMGGWFYVTNAQNDRTDQAEYWVQVSYLVASPTAPSNNTTITMTKYNQQREDKTKGTICATDTVVTETAVLDLRELQTKSTITPGADGPLKIWSVNLLMNGGKALIRKRTSIAPPTVVAAAGVAPSPSAAAAPSPPAAAAPNPSCPALRNGQTVVASTQQSDTSTYSIQFADEGQAKYFQMLISGAAPNMSPPRSMLAPPIP